MRTFMKILFMMAAILLLSNPVAMAATTPVNATCAVSVTVDGALEWAGNFTAAALATMTTQAAAPESSETATLYTNGNVILTAVNTTAAQLSCATDELVTEYKLATDGNGTAATGNATDVTTWTDYTTFLTGGGLALTHVADDGNVLVTLEVKAEHPAAEMADAGSYTATATIIATWNP